MRYLDFFGETPLFPKKKKTNKLDDNKVYIFLNVVINLKYTAKVLANHQQIYIFEVINYFVFLKCQIKTKKFKQLSDI